MFNAAEERLANYNFVMNYLTASVDANKDDVKLYFLSFGHFIHMYMTLVPASVFTVYN